MAVCARCDGDSIYGRRKDRPIGRDMNLVWLCSGCHPEQLPRLPRRGLSFYRRVVYQVVLPVMGFIFALVELGIHT